MQKNLTEIRQKIAWVQNRLRSPRLGAFSRRRAIIYLSALVLMLGKGQKAMATTSASDNNEVKTEVMDNSKETKTLDNKTVDIFRMSPAEVLKSHNIEQVSLADIKNVCQQQEFKFSGEELRAMKPGKLAQSLIRQSRQIAAGKKCLGKCFSKFKSVLFSHTSRQLLKQVDDSYVPQERWNTLSAYKGKEDMETLPQFVCSKLDYENYKDIPDGSAVVFMPSKGHRHGHIAWKYKDYFLSDGQEIIDNISEGKYGQAYVFIPVDNTMEVIQQSEHLAQLANDIKLKNISQPQGSKLSIASLSVTKPPQTLASRN